MPTLTLGQTSLNYQLHHPNAASTPLVLVHGFPLDGRIWEDVAAHFTDRPVLVPDLRGFGASSDDQPFTIPSLADDLNHMLAQLNLRPCVMAGLSMGGYVALAFAEQHRESLAGLALVDTRSGDDTPDGKEKRMAMIDLVRQRGAEGVTELMLPNMIAPTTAEARPGVKQRLVEIMHACPPRTIERACLAMRDRKDYTPLLAQLDLPTAVICGESDAITGPNLARAMVDALPDAALHVVPEAGHMAPLEQPEAVTEALKALLERCG